MTVDVEICASIEDRGSNQGIPIVVFWGRSISVLSVSLCGILQLDVLNVSTHTPLSFYKIIDFSRVFQSMCQCTQFVLSERIRLKLKERY